MTGAIYNLVAILAAIALWMATANNPLSFAWGILLGALVGNFLLPLIASTRGPREDRLRFRPSLDLNSPGVKKVFIATCCRLCWAFSFPVVDQIVGSGFASHLPEGALTQLDNANRVFDGARFRFWRRRRRSRRFRFWPATAPPPNGATSATSCAADCGDFCSSRCRFRFCWFLISKPLIVLLFRHGEYSQASARATGGRVRVLQQSDFFAWAGQQIRGARFLRAQRHRHADP